MHRIIGRRKFLSLRIKTQFEAERKRLVCRPAKHSDFSLKSKKLQLLRAIKNHAQSLQQDLFAETAAG